MQSETNMIQGGTFGSGSRQVGVSLLNGASVSTSTSISGATSSPASGTNDNSVSRPASYFAASARQGAFAVDANTRLAHGFAEGAGLTTQDLSDRGNDGALSSAALQPQIS